MPRLPWKRGDASAELPPLSSYLPLQPVDYTALPIVEDESLGTRFRGLPPVARFGVIALPLVLVGLAVWGVTILTDPAPVRVSAPEIILGQVQAVNPTEISIDGTTANVPDGTPITATLIVDGSAVDWADPTARVGTVTGNRLSMRVRKAEAWSQPLAVTGAYSVEVMFGTQPPVASRATLIVPGPIAAAFYAAGGTQAVPTEEPIAAPTLEPTVAPTPAPTETVAPTEEPTVEPTAEPTALPPTPTVEGPPTISAAANAALLISPTLGSGIVGRPDAGTTFQPILRTPDNQFFLVLVDGQAGWLPAGQATIDPAVAARVPATTPPAEAVQAGPWRATVANGGNIRFLPNIRTGTVLGQMHAYEDVTLKARTSDSRWYRIVAPAAEGWVSAVLLRIPASVAAQVPVAAPADFAPQSGGAADSHTPTAAMQAVVISLPEWYGVVAPARDG